AEARAEEERLVARSGALERMFEENEKKAAEYEALLRQKMGTSGELFGVVRQVAGDTRGHLEASIITAQFPGRAEPMGEMGQSKALPTLDGLEKLWYALLQEMTEQGRVVRFKAPVSAPNGQTSERTVVRVGPFNAIADGQYLLWQSDVARLTELGRQPLEHFRVTATALQSATEGTVWFALDPSRGAVLARVVDKLDPWEQERIEQGGVIGWVILVLGAVAGAIGLLRLLYLAFLGMLVGIQSRRVARPGRFNPLGRVLNVHKKDPTVDVETLERRLDEVVAHEAGRLEFMHWLVKVVSVVAPLLGLLGTVTGMIETFQSITLFGTGDPKMMAGGISEALVTTMLGLVVAIPLVLLHSAINNLARRIGEVLFEQSAGLVAQQAEKHPS
ncbi:MAG: MotA/TolQ/ExbB proton channel family protein, partial [Myxococcales bacterium]|nr:MotA/TolQ/ExbB proton channel family protein [Myxococcales bacterium]